MNFPYFFSRLTLICGLVCASAINSNAQNAYREVALDCGGWVSGFTQHPGGRLYGFGDIFGLYRSDDFGANWQFLQSSLTEDATFVVGVTVFPTDANRVAFNGFRSIWTSTNGGDSWTKRLGDLNLSTNTRGTTPIAYHPTQANELWLASTRSGQSSTLWRSLDNGSSWSALGDTAFSNEEAITIHFLQGAPNEVWVGTRAIKNLSATGGLWCSSDGGTTWTKVWNNNGAQTQYYDAPKIHSIARNASRVSLFASNTGIWRVTASDWSTPSTYVVTPSTFADQSVNVTALADGTFWAREIGDQTWAPKVSPDGITWTDRQITMTAAYVPEWATATQVATNTRVYGRDMLVQDVNNPNRWLLTGGASAHLSEDNGITWRYQPGGMAGIAGWRTTFDRTNPGRAYLASSDRGIFVVTDGGLTGRSTHCSRKTFKELHTYHEAMASVDGQTIIGAGLNQEINRSVIIRSDDGGASWAKLAPTGLPENYEGIQRAVMSLNDPNDYLVLLAFTDKTGQPNNPGLYRTTNGTSFTKVGGTTFDGLNTGTRYDHFPSHLERDGVNPNVRYLSLRAANNSYVRGVWRSTDGGSNWTQRTDPFGGQWTWAFAVDPTIEGRLWAGAAKLRRSDDGGGTWNDVGYFIHVRSIDAHSGRLAVLGRRSGDTLNKIYTSADNGATWQEKTSSENRMIWAKTVAVDPWRPGQTWFSGSRSWQIINPPTPLDPILTGEASGSTLSEGDNAFAANAYDANTGTFFAPAAEGGHTQLDLGADTTARATAVRFFPRAEFESRMNDGRFEGSTDGVAWTTLHSLASAPSDGWQTVNISDPMFYRYLRYFHPTGLADVAEIEFRGLISTAPMILNQPLPTVEGFVGQAVSYSIDASGIPAPTFSITSGTLPTGLTLNPTTGLISGRPTIVSLGSVTVEASNFKGSNSATLNLNIPLGPRLTATTPAPTYTQATNTTGIAPILLTNTGDAPLSWVGSLPTVAGNFAVAESNTAGSGVTYEWIDAINGGTKLIFGSADDSNAGPIPLPFSFVFYGVAHNSLRVCTNGWVSFSSTRGNFVANLSLPNSSSPENMIAPFFADLYLRSDSGVYHRAIDAQTFVISYVDLVRFKDKSSPNPERYSFQIVLKSDGRIFYYYQKIPNLPFSYNIDIGMQNSNSTIGTYVAQPSPISGLTGQAYRFSPPFGWLAALGPDSSSAAGTTLAPGASMTLDATIDTTGIADGETRTANLTFSSSDPINPTRAVPFNLTVNAPPALSNSTIISESFNYPIGSNSPDPDGDFNEGNGLPATNLTGDPAGTSTGFRGSWGNTTDIVNGLVYAQGSYMLNSRGGAALINNNTPGDTSPLTYRSMITDPHIAHRVGGSNVGNFGVSGSSIYMSLIGQTSSGTADAFRLSFRHNDSADFFLCNSTDGWSLNGTPAVGAALALNTPTLFVLRFDFETTTTISLWVNPSLSQPLGAANATVTGVTFPGFGNLLASPTVANAMKFDEFRLGTSLESVIPFTETNTLAIFRATHGLAPDGSHDVMNPAEDSVQNILKYAFNMIGTGPGQGLTLSTSNRAILSPTGDSGLPLLSIEEGTGKLQVTYIRRKMASNSGISYAVEFSDGLDSWDVNASEEEFVKAIDATFERVTLRDSIAQTARFARVRVTIPKW